MILSATSHSEQVAHDLWIFAIDFIGQSNRWSSLAYLSLKEVQIDLFITFDPRTKKSNLFWQSDLLFHMLINDWGWQCPHPFFVFANVITNFARDLKHSITDQLSPHRRLWFRLFAEYHITPQLNCSRQFITYLHNLNFGHSMLHRIASFLKQPRSASTKRHSPHPFDPPFLISVCLHIVPLSTGKYREDATRWRYVHVDDMRELGRYMHIHIPYNGGYGPYTHVPNPYVHYEPQYEESNPYGSYRYLFLFTKHNKIDFVLVSSATLLQLI